MPCVELIVICIRPAVVISRVDAVHFFAHGSPSPALSPHPYRTGSVSKPATKGPHQHTHQLHNLVQNAQPVIMRCGTLDTVVEANEVAAVCGRLPSTDSIR